MFNSCVNMSETVLTYYAIVCIIDTLHCRLWGTWGCFFLGGEVNNLWFGSFLWRKKNKNVTIIIKSKIWFIVDYLLKSHLNFENSYIINVLRKQLTSYLRSEYIVNVFVLMWCIFIFPMLISLIGAFRY